ncbi:hypothetical protein LTR66_001712 [Elasticomyces elasticus]|nr:hypothetical protein LTR66_001712 [Elasticomyces elasticus]
MHVTKHKAGFSDTYGLCNRLPSYSINSTAGRNTTPDNSKHPVFRPELPPRPEAQNPTVSHNTTRGFCSRSNVDGKFETTQSELSARMQSVQRYDRPSPCVSESSDSTSCTEGTVFSLQSSVSTNAATVDFRDVTMLQPTNVNILRHERLGFPVDTSPRSPVLDIREPKRSDVLLRLGDGAIGKCLRCQPTPYRRLSPTLRMQCNRRQRRVFHVFGQLSSLDSAADLAYRLMGDDVFESGLRLCAFLELSIEQNGPFQSYELLQKINEGGKLLRSNICRTDHLVKASFDSITNLIATTVHGLGQRLDVCGLSEMSSIVQFLTLIMSLSGEVDVSKILWDTLPKLKRGELTLCFCLLVATGLDDDGWESSWHAFREMAYQTVRGHFEPQNKQRTALVFVVALIRACGPGSRALFPSLYAGLASMQAAEQALEVWISCGCDHTIWAELVESAILEMSDILSGWERSASRKVFAQTSHPLGKIVIPVEDGVTDRRHGGATCSM